MAATLADEGLSLDSNRSMRALWCNFEELVRPISQVEPHISFFYSKNLHIFLYKKS